ncbi:MAG: PIN domain-containing protein [Lentisphaeria bacterium]|nr:PIN domain-containing protein [Lentisphaeria bacterium]
MKKIFIDTNILLDVVLRRTDFCEQSAAVWADCESRKVQGVVSAISLNNMHYVVRKRVESAAALEYVRFVLNIFSVVPLDESILRLAVDLPGKDFEDAIQTFSAVQAKADCIVTRDRLHFPNSYMPVISPAEYLDLRSSGQSPG